MTHPFHSGEIAVQEMAGERDQAVLNGRNISTVISAPAAVFLSRQEMCVLAWRDRSGDPWASVVCGPPGFATVGKVGKVLLLELDDRSGTLTRLPPFECATVGDSIGVLSIDLRNRRRLRVNGRIARISGRRCEISVDQAFPNCPKYIHRRTFEAKAVNTESSTSIESGDRLNDELHSWILGADTCFVASVHPDGPVDASHRGGPSGFIAVVDGELHIPDYPGNSMFNTFGNLHLNPVVGLSFLDFELGRQLQITGDVRLDFGSDDRNRRTAGTRRWWRVAPRRWSVSYLSVMFDWNYLDASPFNP